MIAPVKVSLFCAATSAVFVALALSAAAADQPVSTVEVQGPVTGQIEVSGSAARYDRVKAASIQIPLRVSAQLADDGSNRKIIGTDVFFKQSTTGGTEAAVEFGAIAQPSKSFERTQSVELAIQPDGTIARDAITACNAKTGTRSLSVTLAVRVTAGRFNFRWADYDRVAPTAEIMANRDFYAEKEDLVRDVAIDIPVICKSLSAGAIAAAPVANPKPAIAKVEATPVTPRRIDFAPVEQTAVASTAVQRCDGGMIRETSTGEALCLCPGNTERVSMGDNGFACERRARRR